MTRFASKHGSRSLLLTTGNCSHMEHLSDSTGDHNSGSIGYYRPEVISLCSYFRATFKTGASTVLPMAVSTGRGGMSSRQAHSFGISGYRAEDQTICLGIESADFEALRADESAWSAL